jgi:hypothetical protein
LDRDHRILEIDCGVRQWAKITFRVGTSENVSTMAGVRLVFAKQSDSHGRGNLVVNVGQDNDRELALQQGCGETEVAGTEPVLNLVSS